MLYILKSKYNFLSEVLEQCIPVKFNLKDEKFKTWYNCELKHWINIFTMKSYDKYESLLHTYIKISFIYAFIVCIMNWKSSLNSNLAMRISMACVPKYCIVFNYVEK